MGITGGDHDRSVVEGVGERSFLRGRGGSLAIGTIRHGLGRPCTSIIMYEATKSCTSTGAMKWSASSTSG